MAVPVFTPSNTKKEARQSYKQIEVLFIPYGRGFSGKNGFLNGASPSFIQGCCLLCVAESMADINLAALGEEIVSLPGKNSYRTISDSVASTFSLQLLGGSVGTFKFILGISPHTNEAIKWSEYDFGQVGCIIINKYDMNKNPTSSMCIPNVSARVTTVGGVPASGTVSQSFEFYQEEAEIYLVTGDQQWTYSLYYEAGSLLNAFAPDGILDTFSLEKGNNSQTATAPQPILFNPDASGYNQYLAVLRVDSQVPTTNEASFATSTITFVTPPAINKTLLAVYAIDTSAYVDPMYYTTNGGKNLLSETYMGII